ncbi:hypothetical protein OOK29_42185 [Streptomyces phaeochromogenes]|uniref:hypothetical protein n=1 Tax=Streptomyces TaxID=1883 RepID=UPI00225A447F|nr:hypothetical protein [Streptomyces phaeochromogenes]MCX5604758.1 hypothetical protein [Streptomyces phaeochromogenes]
MFDMMARQLPGWRNREESAPTMTDEKKGVALAVQAALAMGGEDLATEVHYPPVDNGLDYLASGVDHLRGEEVGRWECLFDRKSWIVSSKNFDWSVSDFVTGPEVDRRSLRLSG